LVTPMLSCIDVLYAQLLNAINPMGPKKLISPNANIAKPNFSYIDMFLSLIALVMMYSWLPCLQEQLSWTLPSF
jgi:hypothetical protein